MPPGGYRSTPATPFGVLAPEEVPAARRAMLGGQGGRDEPAEPAEPAAPAELAEPIWPAQAVTPVEQVEPGEPGEPGEPTEHAGRAERGEPAEQGEPTEHAGRAERGEPAEPRGIPREELGVGGATWGAGVPGAHAGVTGIGAAGREAPTRAPFGPPPPASARDARARGAERDVGARRRSPGPWRTDADTTGRTGASGASAATRASDVTAPSAPHGAHLANGAPTPPGSGAGPASAASDGPGLMARALSPGSPPAPLHAAPHPPIRNAATPHLAAASRRTQSAAGPGPAPDRPEADPGAHPGAHLGPPDDAGLAAVRDGLRYDDPEAVPCEPALRFPRGARLPVPAHPSVWGARALVLVGLALAILLLEWPVPVLRILGPAFVAVPLTGAVCLGIIGLSGLDRRPWLALAAVLAAPLAGALGVLFLGVPA